MTDFDKRFKKRQDEFDRDWERARRFVWVNIVISFGVGAFIVSVIIMTMRWLGII